VLHQDATGQALGYFYFEDEPDRRSAAKLLTTTNLKTLGHNAAPGGFGLIARIGRARLVA